MKIYTKFGDEGKSTTTFGKIDKGHVYFKVLGGVDEIMAILGIVELKMNNDDRCDSIKNQLDKISDDLKCLLDDLWYNNKENQRLNLDRIEELEQLIDEMSLELEPIQSFIKARGNEIALYVNLARCVVRRVETDYFRLMRSMSMKLDGGRYLNRLSDYLFTLFRYLDKTLT